MQPVDALRVLERLCGAQEGLVTAAQARGCGIGAALVSRLIREGTLEAVERGVYRLTAGPWPVHLEIRVAWLRLDPSSLPGQRNGLGPNDGVVSHRSACVVLELGDIPAPAVELTVPRRRRTAVPYVKLRQRSDLTPDQVAMLNGLPVTNAERTIEDLLRYGGDGGHIGGVIMDAEQRGLIDPDRLAGRVARFAARYGMPGADGRELLQMLAVQATPT